MKTEDWLRTLAEDDHHPRLRPAFRLVLAVAAGTFVSALILLAAAGIRPDFPDAAASWHVQAKFAFAAVLALAAGFALHRTAQPEPLPTRAALALLAAPVALLCAVAIELATTPPGSWSAAAWGTHPALCLLLVPVMALVPLAAALTVFRDAAPVSVGVSGALAGLMSGALGALVYMLRCTDDAPLFVASWYALAIVITAGMGWAVGRRALRW